MPCSLLRGCGTTLLLLCLVFRTSPYRLWPADEAYVMRSRSSKTLNPSRFLVCVRLRQIRILRGTEYSGRKPSPSKCELMSILIALREFIGTMASYSSTLPSKTMELALRTIIQG
ncbi:hypothetical protein QBC47DRAFT_367057 [Echria macrotheca]|uniref:Secreted protein n=1 Tax=Echria macrotheca TaxID=438768 RepID=A0AAJ0BLC4_9PEZI|nr:hypothetical protein QBC47DRAFT_367057 [Echria macrotheca]